MLEMRNVLNTKLNKKGFTLAELLVVVAIIAVLVAVSIPIFTGKLEKTREETDIANMRAAKAVAVVAALDDKLDTDVWASGVAYYNAEDGVLQKAKPTKVYGKGTSKKAGQTYTNYDDAKDYTEAVIKVTITNSASDKANNVKIEWEGAK